MVSRADGIAQILRGVLQVTDRGVGHVVPKRSIWELDFSCGSVSQSSVRPVSAWTTLGRCCFEVVSFIPSRHRLIYLS